MSDFVMLIASAKIPAGKKCDFSRRFQQDSLPHPTTPHPPTNKAPLKNKNCFQNKTKTRTKQCFLPLPHWFSMQQKANRKANKYTILMATELVHPVSASSTRSQNFMPPALVLNTNFIKRESKIGYP